MGLERDPRSRGRDSCILALLGQPRIPSGRARNLVPAWPQGPTASVSTVESEGAFRPAPERQPGLPALCAACGPRGEASGGTGGGAQFPLLLPLRQTLWQSGALQS